MNKRLILGFIIAMSCMLQISACGKTDNTVNTSEEVIYSENDDKSNDVTVIDVFKDLNVTFEGVNDKGELKYEYVGDSDFVKENVWNYKCSQNYGLRNGETVIISLDYNEYKAEQEHIEFKETEHEYIVEGLWGSIVSYEGYDFSEIDDWAYSFFTENDDSKYVKNYLNECINSQNDPTNNDYLTLISKPDGNIEGVGTRDAAYWRLLSVECQPCAKILYIFENKDFGQENNYTLYYKVSVKAEKSSYEVNFPSEDTIYNVGDVKEWNYIGAVQFTNVSVTENSNIVYSYSDSPTTHILDTTSEYYDSDYSIFFANYLKAQSEKYTNLYYLDLNTNTPHWEIK